MTPQEEQLITEKFKTLHAEYMATQDILKIIHDDIKEAKEDGKKTMVQAYKTNGRVTRLEAEMKEIKHVSDYAAKKVKEVETSSNQVKKETWIIRYAFKSPKRALSLFFGIIFFSATLGTKYGPAIIEKTPKVIKWITKFV